MMMRFSDIPSPKIKNVQLTDHLGSESNVLGTVHMTTSHFIFKAENSGKEIWVANNLIGSFERSQPSATGSPLIIKCKHFMVLTLLFAKSKDCQDLFEAFIRQCKLVNINDTHAFTCKEIGTRTRLNSLNTSEWWRLEWNAEFQRQGVNASAWKESDFNTGYIYCDTYPQQLWTPASASTQLLVGSCRFRSRARLPVLTYFYKHNGAAICRCSQPLAGFSARCVEDESLMNLIMQANSMSPYSPLFIIDARPKVNAMMNKMQGKGFEDIRNYTNMQFHFFDIENIHVVRGSLGKLLDGEQKNMIACQRPLSITEYLKAVDGSGWLRHLRSLLECGKFIAEAVLHGTSCVVHCSDGWDRTSQTVSLAQIILDPFYRTIKGFQVLLDKDWMCFGFKFDDRCAHISMNCDESSKEISPIFTQFLDVVWQLTRQKPLAFEFNERFLLEINEHAYSCEYGTFVGNCDKDRRDLRVVQRTQSLWRQMDKRIDDYRNPFYKKKSAAYLMDVDLRPSAFVVWTAMYNRFDTGIQPREYIADVALTSKQHIEFMTNVLEDKDNQHTFAAKWQSLLNAHECSSEACRREFLTRFERRIHCTVCGKIFCLRCIISNQIVCKECSLKSL